jgi:hypothetical protein
LKKNISSPVVKYYKTFFFFVVASNLARIFYLV